MACWLDCQTEVADAPNPAGGNGKCGCSCWHSSEGSTSSARRLQRRLRRLYRRASSEARSLDAGIAWASGRHSSRRLAFVLQVESGQEATSALMKEGIYTTPMDGWGEAHGKCFVRFVFSNEPCHRLKGIGTKVRTALKWPGPEKLMLP